MSTEIMYRISGLTKIDQLELATDPTFILEEASVPSGTHGEVITLTALVAASAVTALGAFLLRKHEGESFEEVIEEVHPNGTIKRHIIRWKHDSAEPPDASIIKQLRPGV
jgi:hypothetical protein